MEIRHFDRVRRIVDVSARRPAWTAWLSSAHSFDQRTRVVLVDAEA